MSVKVHASKVEMVPVNKLLAYEKNARTHSDHQIKLLANAIKASGFTNPLIIDPNNVLIAGHGRLEAARLLEMPDVPCVRVKGLTDAQIKALRVSDNQIALLSEWDVDILAEELRAMAGGTADMSLVGFSDDELADLLKPDAEPPTSPDAFPEFGEDIDTQHKCPKCGYAWSGKAS